MLNVFIATNANHMPADKDGKEDAIVQLIITEKIGVRFCHLDLAFTNLIAKAINAMPPML